MQTHTHTHTHTLTHAQAVCVYDFSLLGFKYNELVRLKTKGFQPTVLFDVKNKRLIPTSMELYETVKPRGTLVTSEHVRIVKCRMHNY